MANFYSTESKIICEDHYALAATIYVPSKNIKAAILIGPATGIKRQFYASFASFLADNGYGVITFDNRGIGDSLVGNVKASDASLQCWGEKDMPAALEQLKKAFPNTHYHLIGHSAGGQLVGLMHNAMDFTSIFNFACSSGQLKNMSPLHAIKAHFFMNIFIPFSNGIFGHTKSQWFGMGEPLPKKVAQQWRAWCNGEGYVKSSFGKTIHNHLYDDLSVPSMWVNATDDFIAINANVKDMLTVFTQLNAETVTLSPKDYALDEIGHMKFFSRKSHVLWSYALNWLERY
ncbi:alpha/beta fold hydrolase [Colwellia sp. KU-HH00111]|uniref:alpha/beta hydrolase family protein n=1 Tax=Colwellia sp. KU-HH00111 TaxID=3127652 RepID=UPI00310335E1